MNAAAYWEPGAVRFYSDGPIPAGLEESFWEYDRALLTNDVTAMDELFAEGAMTLRGDGAEVLVGHEAISRYRQFRSDLPSRRVVAVHVRILCSKNVLTMAEVASPAFESKGLQTQLWQNISGRWRITAAHVTAPPKIADGPVWRPTRSPIVSSASGPLSGLSMAVKDVFAVEGFPIGAGVREYLAEATPQQKHAAPVSALVNAGAELTGITQTDQFAYSITGLNEQYGAPTNPAARSRIPGGSSSGSATAVASGIVSVGLGTDTAGSIRVPGSCQGLWGIRTTHGAIDLTGVLPLSPSFDTVGWLARDGATLFDVASVLFPTQGASAADSDPGLVTFPALNNRADARISRSVAAAAAKLNAKEIPFHPDFESWAAAFRTVQAWEAWQVHGSWILDHPGALSPDVAARFEAAASVTQGQASLARYELHKAEAALMRELDGRVLILPTIPLVPPLLATDQEELTIFRQTTLQFTCIASLAGLPAVTIPALKVQGVPTGLCLIGQKNTDLSLIRLAQSSAANLAHPDQHP